MSVFSRIDLAELARYQARREAEDCFELDECLELLDRIACDLVGPTERVKALERARQNIVAVATL